MIPSRNKGYINIWPIVIIIAVVCGVLGWAVIEGAIWAFQNVSIHIN